MPDRDELLALADRVEGLDGPDREVDALIAERVHGWTRATVGPDYDHKNVSEVLTKDGKLVEGFAYPPRGAVPLYFHVPKYTRDVCGWCGPDLAKDAIRQSVAAALRARAEKSDDS